MSKVETVSKLPTASVSVANTLPSNNLQIAPHKFNPVQEDNPLKPCPFCGNPNVQLFTESEGMHFEMGTGYIVRCNFLRGGCGARGGSRSDKEEAIKAWNERRK